MRWVVLALLLSTLLGATACLSATRQRVTDLEVADPGAYPTATVVDPQGPASGSLRMNRGGSWASGAEKARAAYRGKNGPGFREYYMGVRPARSSP